MSRSHRTIPAATLADLPDGSAATVQQVQADGAALDAMQLHRLRELGFLPGEPVQVVRRGPGGREPLAVQVGDTLFALRLAEARCVLVA
ncbi:FeoA family protein [Ideonella sp. DXS22W]|uniref:FeoA family protein n=1 Tax=Pseudaquabacterium inlustre TaxID=2984192 RepID=A0ABU9CCH5_9BURK